MEFHIRTVNNHGIWLAEVKTNNDTYFLVKDGNLTERQVVDLLVDSVFAGYPMIGEYDPEICATYEMIDQILKNGQRDISKED